MVYFIKSSRTCHLQSPKVLAYHPTL